MAVGPTLMLLNKEILDSVSLEKSLFRLREFRRDLIPDIKTKNNKIIL